jgi:hypothetical protein
MAWKYNPFTNTFDLAGEKYGSRYLDGEVEYHADLPVAVGSPAVGVAYLVQKSSGVWFVNRKARGIWERTGNTGALSDWEYTGTYRDVFDDEVFRLYNGGAGGDVTKELAFDLSDISPATTRTLKVPNASGTVVLHEHTGDIELMSAANGIIFRNGLGERVRLTLGADNQLVRTILPILLILGMALSTSAQIARDLGLDASRRVVTGTNTPIAFTNAITSTSSATFGSFVVGGTNANTNAEVYSPSGITFSNADAAAQTLWRSNTWNALGSLPSGAAALGTPALADGSGGTAFSTPTRWTVTSGTVTSNAPALDASQTWSNAATTFRGINLAISNVASSNSSTAINVIQNNTNVFQVFANGVVGATSYSAAGNVFGSILLGGSSVSIAAMMVQQGSGGYATIGDALYFGWSSSGNLSAAHDLRLFRDAAGSKGQRNGTNSQTNNIYGSFSNSTNYRRLSMGMSNNGTAFIRPESAGPLATNNRLIIRAEWPTNTNGLESGTLWNSNGIIAVMP